MKFTKPASHFRFSWKNHVYGCVFINIKPYSTENEHLQTVFFKFKMFWWAQSRSSCCWMQYVLIMKRDFFKVSLSLSDLVLWLSHGFFSDWPRFWGQSVWLVPILSDWPQGQSDFVGASQIFHWKWCFSDRFIRFSDCRMPSKRCPHPKCYFPKWFSSISLEYTSLLKIWDLGPVRFDRPQTSDWSQGRSDLTGPKNLNGPRASQIWLVPKIWLVTGSVRSDWPQGRSDFFEAYQIFHWKCCFSDQFMV